MGKEMTQHLHRFYVVEGTCGEGLQQMLEAQPLTDWG
jgi:hypothetical protein